jgi:hypothetical protein
MPQNTDILFDSESDRRDFIRQRIVTMALASINEIISDHAASGTREERHYLELAIAAKLVEGQRIEAMSVMMRGEFREAEKQLKDSPL